jgi:hypothetical protein
MDAITIGMIVIPLSLSSIAITRIVTNRHLSSKVMLNSIKKDYETILENKMIIIEELKRDLMKYKNKASNMERGPSMEGEVGELDNILPSLVAEFEPYAPKWLKPFLGDKDAQQWIIKYVQEHPEKAQQWIGKFLRPKGAPAPGEQQTEIL